MQFETGCNVSGCRPNHMKTEYDYNKRVILILIVNITDIDCKLVFSWCTGIILHTCKRLFKYETSKNKNIIHVLFKNKKQKRSYNYDLNSSICVAHATYYVRYLVQFMLWLSAICINFVPERGAQCCDQRVCLSVCLSAHIS